MTNAAPSLCSACGAPADGKFCSSCGAPLTERRCSTCGAATTAGARFCVNCGVNFAKDEPATTSHTPAIPFRPGWWAPWRITALLAVACMAAILWAAARETGQRKIAGPVAGASGGDPDLSGLPPHERYIRLADRVETSMQAGDTASVVRFFPMVEAAFARLSPADRDIDARFHLSLLRAQVGHFPSAKAEVDSILAVAPSHLFAFYLQAIIADYQGDAVAANTARAAFRTHFAAETATRRPEYQAHRILLNKFLKTTPTR